jgi:hypothetical protein
VGIFGTNPQTEKKVDGYLRGQLWNRPVEAKGQYYFVKLVAKELAFQRSGIFFNIFSYGVSAAEHKGSIAINQESTVKDGAGNLIIESSSGLGSAVQNFPFSQRIYGYYSPANYNGQLAYSSVEATKVPQRFLRGSLSFGRLLLPQLFGFHPGSGLR